MPLDPLMQEIIDTVRTAHRALIAQQQAERDLAQIEEARAADARRAVLQEAADWLRTKGLSAMAKLMMKELNR